MSMGMTAKKLAFIDYYKSAECAGNASKAAIKAGFSPRNVNRTASRLLKDVDIASQINAFVMDRREKYSKDTFIDQAYSDYQKLSLDDSPMARLRALELSAKLLGHLKNEESNVNIIIGSDSLTNMRASLMNRGKIIGNNIPNGMPSITPPPVNTIDISASQQSSDTASQHDSITAEKKLDSTDEGGIDTPSHP